MAGEVGRLVRGGKLFQNSQTGLRLRTHSSSGGSPSSSFQVSLWADSILHCNRPPGSTTSLPPSLPFLSLNCCLYLSRADSTFTHCPPTHNYFPTDLIFYQNFTRSSLYKYNDLHSFCY